ncbi:MAG: universal stress protein, partial [Bacteroidales bacterium]|nr:universal stress protein [Bacteroidales bacterium]
TKEGSIFSTISEVATQIEANLVIMGTHGMKGMQKFTGSWALKVIVGSRVPFIVVQAPPNNSSFHDIVFPINFKSENKEPMNWIVYLSKYYRSKIHFFKEDINDQRLKRKVNNNIIYAKKILDSKSVDYDIFTSEGKKSFSEQTIDYADQINADLILVMTTKNIGFTDYVFSADEQRIIANSHKIPVMCVNPREDLKKIVWY